ncbi:hypothetical protein [uncultured Propionivibrio sp.]|uniref:hypothetical protein n=1 Tax=uncultured Propionivibrio sp. TaxID=426737 RepID=UPI0029C030A0|nr:hypothetical protein [uncultured Propionivibrio sp.]
MKIEKRFLTEFNRCYSANHLSVDARTRILLATEGEGACKAWIGPEYSESHNVWEAPGGTMSIVPIPGTNGEFLAVQKFFKMFQWEEAKVVHVKPRADGGYDVTDILALPYIHRFDLLTVGGRHYFIGCTLATKKDSKEDWSNPGKIWVGEYTGPGPLQVRALKEGLTQNHGYDRLTVGDRMSGLVTCREGAFEVTPPQTPGADWQVEQFMDWPISDISTIDIDGDGELEFATIEPFHGEYFRVYKRIDGKFVRIFEHPEVTEFYHVVVGATLAGTPVFVGGCRRGKQQLFYVKASRSTRPDAPLALEAVVIEEGVGPSNVHVINEAGRDIIVAANREKGEAALYFVTPD